jgi:hypothetical protein
VQVFPRWKENILYFIARCLGLKGLPIGFIYYEDEDKNIMTINDIKRSMEEDEANSVRTQTTNRMESGE